MTVLAVKNKCFGTVFVSPPITLKPPLIKSFLPGLARSRIAATIATPPAEMWITPAPAASFENK